MLISYETLFEIVGIHAAEAALHVELHVELRCLIGLMSFFICVFLKNLV